MGLAIVATLAALIVPAYHQVLQGMHSAKCANNLRVLAVAGQLYANEHDGNFTHRRFMHSIDDPDGEPGLREYVGIFKKTTGVNTVFTCPALQKKYPTTKYAENRNYVINRFATFEYTPKTKLYQKFTSVPKPSAMAYLMDGYLDPDESGKSGSYAYSSHVVAADVGKLLYPHKELNHVVFLDGHVERMSKEEMEGKAATDPFWRGGED